MSRRLIFAALALLCAGAVSAQKRTETPAASSEVRYVGRTQTKGGDVSFDWSGTSFECRFTGGSLAMRVSDTKKNYYNLTVDGRDAGVVTTFGTDSVVVLAEKLGRGEHTVRMQKRCPVCRCNNRNRPHRQKNLHGCFQGVEKVAQLL